MPTAGNPIGLNYARKLADNYVQKKLGQTLLQDDTQAVWFSKETILTALGLPADTETNEVTGLRFYFGAYEDEPGFPESSTDQNRLTLVIVQTGDTLIDFVKDDNLDAAYADIIEDMIPGEPTQPGYPSADDPSPNMRYYNDGQTSPPPTDLELGLMDWN